MPTAGVVIIGDEILSGKFVEENAKFLIGAFQDLGVELRRITVIPDDLDDIAETAPADTPDGFAELAAKQRSSGVKACMAKLSDEHRECMHLVFFEGLSLAEVAAVQGCPENTVKTRLFHARQKIRNCLKLMVERDGELPVGAAS